MDPDTAGADHADCPDRLGCLSALSLFLCKLVFYGAFVWAHRALNIQKRRFSARAVTEGRGSVRAGAGRAPVTVEQWALNRRDRVAP